MEVTVDKGFEVVFVGDKMGILEEVKVGVVVLIVKELLVVDEMVGEERIIDCENVLFVIEEGVDRIVVDSLEFEVWEEVLIVCFT